MTPFPTIASALDSMRSGELDPRTLTEGAIDRIAALNGRICAYILTTEDLARSCAQTAAQAYAEGAARPLEGIPLAYKDIYETAGIRSTGHSRVLEHHVPAQDASSVKALKAAGGVTLGKLATHEFAFGGPSSDLPWPIARNPWHTDHFTGGSSSGSGAAIAAGMALGATGSDTGGSIRLPRRLFRDRRPQALLWPDQSAWDHAALLDARSRGPNGMDQRRLRTDATSDGRT